MYKVLGLINIALIIVITAPYWLRRIAKIFSGGKNAFTGMIKTLRKVHKPCGVCLLLVTLIHGYLALGTLRLHTGTLVGIMVLVTVVLGILFYRKKKAIFFKWHRRSALATVLLTLVHLIVPNAFYYLIP